MPEEKDLPAWLSKVLGDPSPIEGEREEAGYLRVPSGTHVPW